MKKLKYFILTLCFIFTFSLPFSFIGCANKNEGTKLSFKSASSYDYLKTLDGKTVNINGYVATSSPVDGSFIFLMNLPYQNCPFCIPNTSMLSNTIEVYPKSGKKFSYTNQAIKVVGTLKVAKNENEPFTDKYGYEFNFKIVNATYSVVKSNELSEDLAMWQEIAESGVVDDLYSMYDYLNFVCKWNSYYINSYVNSSGNTIKGYYITPAMAQNYLFTDGAQWNYGFKDDYFDNIIKKIENIDSNRYSELISNVESAENLATYAINQLTTGKYTYEYKYVSKFNNYCNVYTLNNASELNSRYNNLYYSFTNWISSYEM